MINKKEVITVNNELKHYGVKGQKWGVRRYQNNDGSLTPEGRKRYGDDDDDRSGGNSGGGNGNHKPNKTGKSKDSVETMVKGINTTKKGVDDLASNRVKQRESEGKRNYRHEATQLTDKELRDAVNRLNMEESYAKMMSSRYVDAGHTKADALLSNAGTALTVANTVLGATSTVLGIMLAMKQLRG